MFMHGLGKMGFIIPLNRIEWHGLVDSKKGEGSKK